ncbi:MAG: hypothetical protein Kow0029_23340 [Candidatus Rifleibacteriota bacterium]
MAKDKNLKPASILSISFRQKIATIFTLLITFIMLVSVYLVTFQVKKFSLQRAKESGRLLGRIIALSMGEDIVRGNFQGVNYALKEFSKLERVEFCLIIDNFGKIISSTEEKYSGKYFSDAWSRSALSAPEISIRKASVNGRPVYDTSVPIVIGGKRHALIRAGFTLSEEYASIRSLLAYNLSLGIILILAGVFIAYAVSSTLLSPLNAILSSIESMSRGDFSQKAYVSTSDEFEQLASSFNKLSSFLQNRQSAEKYITKKIWDSDEKLKEKHFSGKTIQSVVLYLELYRFSNFVERHSPSEAVDTLNSFLEQTTNIIASSGGIIDKYNYGSITAIFPISKSDQWPAFLRAAFAALHARNNLKIFNFRQTQLGLEDMNLKTGISTGNIIVGRIGTSSRSDFSALGNPVSQAQKAAEYSGRHNQYRPVVTMDLVKMSSDFLNFSQLDIPDQIKSDENPFYSLISFANLSYFREKLNNVSERGNLSIIMAFGLTETKDGFEFLKKLITDKENEYRKDAIKALSPYIFAENSEAKELLKQLISEDEDPQTVALATSVLSWAKDKSLIEFFTRLFEHSNDRVRANAIEACIPLDFTAKKELFKKMLDDNAPRVCANALLGLWLADDQESLTCLYELLKADNSKKRASGAYAIYFLSASRRFRRLFPAYSEEENFSMLPIVENILKRLGAMLESQDYSERYQALRAVGKVGFKDLKKNIIELLELEEEPEIISLAHSILKDWEFHGIQTPTQQ